MSRKIVWASKARRDLVSQLACIADDSPRNAALVRERVEGGVAALSRTAIGRPSRVPGTYENFVPKTSLVICYELPDEATLPVLRMIHISRNWPKGGWPAED